ncbi:MAG: Ldh family oxidoreductase [Planctomycetia bacterium]
MSTPIAPADLAAFVRAAGEKAGLSPEAADTLAEPLVLADMMGVHTHGTKLLAGYLRKLLACGYRPTGVPKIVREGPAWAVVDGDAALGQVGCTMAMRLAIAKAKQVGVASVSIRNTGHIGAAGYYALMAAREGCLGLVAGNDIPTVAAPGSRGAVFGSNPLAYAAPVPGGDPLLFDISTAAVAGGKVYAAVARGEPIPGDWLIGEDGRPTSDGSLYPAKAVLAPMAGHKGYGFAMFAELLSGVLSGGMVALQVGHWMVDPPEVPSRHSAGFVVIDVEAICDREAYAAAMNTIVRHVHGAPTVAGIERVFLPGELEWRRHKAAASAGIPLPADVREKLAAAAALVGLASPA